MKAKKLLGMLTVSALIVSMFSGCVGQEQTSSTEAPKAEMTDEERIISAADEGKVGN